RPTAAARSDRFVIRSYSPSRTIGGGSVIEPAATRRRRHGGGLEALAVHESGSLEARLLERLEREAKPAAVAVLARDLGESEATLGASPAEGRWLSIQRWEAARWTLLERGERLCGRPSGALRGDEGGVEERAQAGDGGGGVRRAVRGAR